jgi:hypothetical protein
VVVYERVLNYDVYLMSYESDVVVINVMLVQVGLVLKLMVLHELMLVGVDLCFFMLGHGLNVLVQS